MAGYTIERKEEQCLVVMRGDLTAPLIPDLQAALKNNVQQGANEVVFDLANTVMLDSSGIGLLVATCNSLGSQKRENTRTQCIARHPSAASVHATR